MGDQIMAFGGKKSDGERSKKNSKAEKKVDKLLKKTVV